MQLFGGKFSEAEEEKPRSNFDSFYEALLTVFQVRCFIKIYTNTISYQKFQQ